MGKRLEEQDSSRLVIAFAKLWSTSPENPWLSANICIALAPGSGWGRVSHEFRYTPWRQRLWDSSLHAPRLQWDNLMNMYRMM